MSKPTDPHGTPENSSASEAAIVEPARPAVEALLPASEEPVSAVPPQSPAPHIGVERGRRRGGRRHRRRGVVPLVLLGILSLLLLAAGVALAAADVLQVPSAAPLADLSDSASSYSYYVYAGSVSTVAIALIVLGVSGLFLTLATAAIVSALNRPHLGPPPFGAHNGPHDVRAEGDAVWPPPHSDRGR